MEIRHDSPSATIDQDVLTFSGELVASTVGELEKIISKINVENIKIVDGSDITALDSTGAFFINRISPEETTFRGFSERSKKLLEISASVEKIEPEKIKTQPAMTFERFGGLALREFERITEIAILVVDILYWSVVGIFDRKQYRKGTFVEQAFYIGASALPIVPLVTRGDSISRAISPAVGIRVCCNAPLTKSVNSLFLCSLNAMIISLRPYHS